MFFCFDRIVCLFGQIILVMSDRNRAGGWKHAKLSGHENEDLVTALVMQDPNVQQALLHCASKNGKVIGVAEGGLCEKSIPSVLGDSTKSKPDVRLLLDNDSHINISIKKSCAGQVFLITVERFILGFEKQYHTEIPQQVKRAISLFWGSADDAADLLQQYARVEQKYQTKRHRLVKDTIDNYDPALSAALLNWFQNNIVEIFDFCFVRGLARCPEDLADVIWYKNLLPNEEDGNTMFKLDEIKKKIWNNRNLVVYGTRTGGSTIQLPFGFVQWHLHQMQFHHNLKSLQSL